MILRHFMRHVKDQNWLAVGLEVLVVIVGIFLGMQVTNWNDARKQDSRALAFETRLRSNLLDDAVGLEERLVYWEQAAEYGEQALLWLEEGNREGRSDAELVVAFYQASNLWRFAPNSSTFDELRSAGELGMIRDAALREDINNYHAIIGSRRSDILYDFVPQYRYVIRGLIPYQVGREIHEKCQDENPTDQSLKTCKPDISAGNAAEILQELRADPEVKKTLRYWINSARIGIDLARLDMASARKLAARLKVGDTQ